MVPERDADDGSDRDARRLHVDQQERDAFLLLGIRIGAHEGENHVGPVRHRRPDLLPVDHIVVAVANRARLEAGEVRAGAGLRVALAPPGLVPDDAAQILLLLLRCAEGVDHRPRHGRAERDQRRCARTAELLLEGKELLGLPTEPTMLLRPFPRQPAARAQPLQPGVVLVTLEMLATRLLSPNLGRHFALAEFPHLSAECIELGVVLDNTNEHGASPLSLLQRPEQLATGAAELKSASSPIPWSSRRGLWACRASRIRRGAAGCRSLDR